MLRIGAGFNTIITVCSKQKNPKLDLDYNSQPYLDFLVASTISTPYLAPQTEPRVFSPPYPHLKKNTRNIENAYRIPISAAVCTNNHPKYFFQKKKTNFVTLLFTLLLLFQSLFSQSDSNGKKYQSLHIPHPIPEKTLSPRTSSPGFILPSLTTCPTAYLFYGGIPG